MFLKSTSLRAIALNPSCTSRTREGIVMDNIKALKKKLNQFSHFFLLNCVFKMLIMSFHKAVLTYFEPVTHVYLFLVFFFTQNRN